MLRQAQERQPSADRGLPRSSLIDELFAAHACSGRGTPIIVHQQIAPAPDRLAFACLPIVLISKLYISLSRAAFSLKHFIAVLIDPELLRNACVPARNAPKSQKLLFEQSVCSFKFGTRIVDSRG